MNNQITLELSADKAFEYQQALLMLLGKIEVRQHDMQLTEQLKAVYELIGELNTKEFRIDVKS